MTKKIKRLGFYVELTEQEDIVVQKLRKKYAINLTQLIKNCLNEYCEKLEKGQISEK
jgi:hypothetical protein